MEPGWTEPTPVEQASELWIQLAAGVEVRRGRLLGGPPGLAAELAAMGIEVRPAITDLGPLAELEARVLARTARPAPNLRSVVRLSRGGGPLPLDLDARLRRWPGVRAAWWDDGRPPPPVDLLPDTPDLEGSQSWVEAENGLDLRAAWEAGHRGAGIRYADVEYWITADHEDLPSVAVEPDIMPYLGFGGDHGTAASGATLAQGNGYGTTGGGSFAEGAFYPEWDVRTGDRRAEAITRACAESLPGDVVHLEMQTFGPRGGRYVPAEYTADVWLATRLCSLAGVVVVAAAGNGDDNLDAAEFAEYRGRGDSGALIVGASTTSPGNWYERASFSTYGQRVNVQGWGEGVATLGYGDLFSAGGSDRREYTGSFSGTSSGSAVVAAAVVALQSAALAELGEPLAPWALRDLLVRTGRPQGPRTIRTPIGPQPDLAVALADLVVDDDGDGALAQDCADADPTRFPGAAELLADGIDQDCDGVVDEGVTDLGLGLAGTTSPIFRSLSAPVAGGRWSAQVADALPGARGRLVIGYSREDAPFFGGTRVPAQDTVLRIGPADGSGALSISGRLPADLAPGDTLWVQVWLEDAAAPEGFSASNALQLVLD